jgi:hypothetical protein
MKIRKDGTQSLPASNLNILCLGYGGRADAPYGGKGIAVFQVGEGEFVGNLRWVPIKRIPAGGESIDWKNKFELS